MSVFLCNLNQTVVSMKKNGVDINSHTSLWITFPNTATATTAAVSSAQITNFKAISDYYRFCSLPLKGSDRGF